MDDLDQLSAAALARPAAQPAIEFHKRWITWGEMRQVGERVGDLIAASGAGPGTRVAFVARNRPSALAALVGMIARRCTIRMVYPFQSATAIARDLAGIEPSVLVAAAEDYPEAIQAVLRSKGIAAIALQEMEASALPGLERTRRAGDAALPPQLEILTSGTTGPPKPFRLSYEIIAKHFVGPLLTDAGAAGDAASLPPALMYFPVGNISGLYSTLPPLLRGQRVVLLERFNVAEWHDHLLRFRPAAGGLPPAAIQMVLDANIPPADLSCLRSLGAGAAPLDPAVQRAFEERYGVPILLSYGATEFGGPVSAMTLELHATWGQKKFGSVGRALPGAQLRVVDPVSGALLPPGQEGILEVISPRIGPDWIRTSDIAVIDEDGFLFHRGRADGAIIRGGFKLLPETIERALLLHPAVAAAAVVGLADQRLGQVPAAVVQLAPGAPQPGAAELEAHLRNHVPATHIPVAWRFVEAVPRTPMSFKVDRPAVRQLFETDRPD
jgi:acyl-coenzyme A synthetase/AMP-(fatty) acid ligase